MPDDDFEDPTVEDRPPLAPAEESEVEADRAYLAYAEERAWADGHLEGDT